MLDYRTKSVGCAHKLSAVSSIQTKSRVSTVSGDLRAATYCAMAPREHRAEVEALRSIRSETVKQRALPLTMVSRQCIDMHDSDKFSNQVND